MVTISPPRIYKKEGKAYFSADIAYSDISRELYFSISEEYEDYFSLERSDAFLVALIPIIAKYGGEVTVEGCISNQLQFQLSHILSPVLKHIDSRFHPLVIHAVTSAEPLPSNHACGTGCSAGIDSLATIAEYTRADTPPAWNLSHALFLNAGSHYMPFSKEHEKNVEHAKILFDGRLNNAQQLCRETGLQLITMDTNLYDFVDEWNHQAMHTYWDSACVLAMQKLFSHYMYASTYHVEKFAFKPLDPAYYEQLLLECFSTESVQFHSTLYTLYRFQRTEIVTKFPVSKKYLNVCLWDIQNCGKCHKCVRTMFQLDLLGKLDEYKHVFPVDEYRLHPEKTWDLLRMDRGYWDEYTTQYFGLVSDPAEREAFQSKLGHNNDTSLPSVSDNICTSDDQESLKHRVEQLEQELHTNTMLLLSLTSYRSLRLQYYRYKLMSKITWGKKREKYATKKRVCRFQLRRFRQTMKASKNHMPNLYL